MYPSSATSIEGIAAVHHAAGLTDNLVANNTATDTDEASNASVSTKQLVS